MMITWEPADIQAGRRVGKGHTVEQWIIGYDPSVTEADDPDLSTKWAVIRLKDGMISCKELTRKQVAVFLNASGDLPVELLTRID